MIRKVMNLITNETQCGAAGSQPAGLGGLRAHRSTTRPDLTDWLETDEPQHLWRRPSGSTRSGPPKMGPASENRIGRTPYLADRMIYPHVSPGARPSAGGIDV